MGVVYRGIKNAFRNNVRTFSVIFILAVSIAMSLVMFLAMRTVQAKIEDVKSSIGNTITVSPAGVRGFEGGGELLTTSQADKIASIDQVKTVIKTITDRLTTDDNTNLESAVEPGSFGERQQRKNDDSSSTNEMPQSAQAPRDFKMPVAATGTNNLEYTANLNVSELNITSGDKFDAATSSAKVAIIGKDLAEKNNLEVGSTFTAYDKKVKVVGIFDGGNTFSNNTVIMPLKTLQTLSDQENQINSIVVEANSIDSITPVEEAIKEKLGDDIDVVSSQDSSKQALEPLENIKTISLYSLIGSVVAGTIIIFLIMMMIVRERRREIGVLKAIGSSNINIVSQFTFESLFLTLASSVLGIILGAVLSNPVLKVLVTNSQSSSVGEGARRAGGMGMRMMGNFLPGAQNTLRDISALVSWDIILYGLAAAVIIAILGSAIPAFLIAKIRPAEVMRTE